MRSHDIVIAGNNTAIKTLNNLAKELRSSHKLVVNEQSANVTVVYDYESVDTYVEEGITALFITGQLSSVSTGNPVNISIRQLSEWRSKYPDMVVYLIVNDDKKSGNKLKNFYDKEFYNCIYNSDLTSSFLVSLLRTNNGNGRTKKEAFKYYGLGANPKAIEETPKEDEVLSLDNENVKQPKEIIRKVAPKKSKTNSFFVAPMEEEDVRRPISKRKAEQKLITYEEVFGDDLDPVDIDEYYEEEKEPGEEIIKPRKLVQTELKRRIEDTRRKAVPSKMQVEDYTDDLEDDEFETTQSYDSDVELDEYNDYDIDDDDTSLEELELEEELSPRRVIYPMQNGENLFYGEVMAVEDNNFMIRVPFSAENTTFDESFVGTRVFFVATSKIEN